MKSVFSLIITLSACSVSILPTTGLGQEMDVTAPKVKKVKIKSSSFKFEKSLKKGLAKAKQQSVPVLLLFTNPATCKYCVMLEKEVFDTKEWKKGVAGKLVGVYIDNNNRDRDAQAIAQSQRVQGIPTYFLLKPDGSIISKGGYHGDDVSSYVSAVESAYNLVQQDKEKDKSKTKDSEKAKDKERSKTDE